MQRIIRPRPAIETTTPATHGGPNYAELAALGLSPDEVIDFSASANPFGPSPRVRAALAGAAIERYPDSQCLALRARLAERHGLTPEQIVAGNGTTELIWLLAVAYLQPGDPVLIVGPTFGEYRVASELMGAAVTEYRAPAQPANFQPELAAIVARVGEQRPRLTWLCNPNNPTGVYLSPAAVERVATACGDGLLVLDEAYRPFVTGAWPSEPLLQHENTILLRSMTKDHALAGLRLGYALAHPGVIAALKRAQPSWSVNAVAQAAGLAALDDDGYVADTVARTHEAKAYLVGELTRLGLRVVPSAANFFLVEVGDGAALRQRLLGHGLVVRDCASFGLPEYVRVGVRRMEECRRLVEAWRTVQGARLPKSRRLRKSAAKTIMIQGTASSVGKSLLVAALCRIFRQDGYRVAPFKAQNMALNSFVTREGHEMGRAQVVQAQAAGLEPHVDMNPILLKPEGEAHSQVVLMGRPWASIPAGTYYRRKRELWPVVAAALDRLRARYDVVVIEGAGSPAEINLRAGDIVNMAVARYAQAPVLLVGDIDRGGVFAALLGTLILLNDDERALVRGLVINKFRGDAALLGDGLTMLEQRTGVPVLGVVPFIRDLRIAEEDSVALDAINSLPRPSSLVDSLPHPSSLVDSSLHPSSPVDIAVIRLPRISNFDDFDALRLEAGVGVRFVDRADELGAPDAVILPGTKNTIADLRWLWERGLAEAIVELAARGRPVVGICGGYQMLGRTVRDPQGVESRLGQADGLGLLPVDTVFEAEKATHQARARVVAGQGFFTTIVGQEVSGYEIHTGHSHGGRPAFRLTERSGRPVDAPDGAVDDTGRVWGTYMHGLFDNPPLRRAWLRSLGWAGDESGFTLPQVREREYDRLAAVVRRSLDMERLYGVLQSSESS